MTLTFQHQWKDDKGRLRAIPHHTTTNLSFLRTAAQFRKMGIRNYAFPLCLYDPDLLHVNVHDLEENTPENEILRTKVMVEAARNGWYFLRECIKIYEQGGSPVSFRLDRGSAAMAWCFYNGIDYTGMQPRQTGKAQPLDANVLTDSGWVEMRDIKIGTKVVSPDGSIVPVIGVYPQGDRHIYEIILSDGRSVECGLDHLWKVHNEKWDDSGKILSLKDLIVEIYDNHQKISLPIFDPSGSDLSLREIRSIDYVGIKEAQCIMVGHDNHLYITDDYIVTHNTVCALSLLSWILYSSGLEFTINALAKDNNLRQENVKRIKIFGENLPKWWLAEDRYKDKKNAEEIYYASLKTHYVTYVAQSEKSAADKQGRGASAPVIHIDELEFCNNIGITYPTMLASTGTARENARNNGKPHSNIITTTAGDPTKPECREAAKILEGAMPFTEHLYDIENLQRLKEVVKAASSSMMIIGIFSHLQLGYDNEWLRDKISRNKMTRDQVMRDYLNRRVSIQEEPVIPKDVLAKINSSQRDPNHIQMLSSKFVIYWYIPKEIVQSSSFRDKPIIVGCDSSEMIGRDSTTLVGIDPTDLSTVFTFRCNEGNINVVGTMIAQLMLMFPKMIFVPENKSSGTSIIDSVSIILRKEGHNPFKRIFNWVVNNRHEREFADIDIRDMSLIDSKVRRYFGIKTDKTKRDELYSTTLIDAATMAATKIRDQNLISELNSLTVRNGRVDHASGSNDDSVIAFLMAMWFILNAKNLDIYGINPGTSMSRLDSTENNKTRMNAERQLKIRDKIEELEDMLKYQKDIGHRKLIEADIGVMKEMLDNGPMLTPQTADELNRHPRRFVDSKTSEASRSPLKLDTVESSLKALLNIGG